MTKDQKIKALLYEANRWLGVTETPENKGEMVRIFQMAVDGKAQGESWCCAFLHYCLSHVDQYAYQIFADTNFHKIPKSESSLNIWQLADFSQKRSAPLIGSIAVWKTGEKSGHVGIVKQIKEGEFLSIEGNTSKPGEPTAPEGVYLKTRFPYTRTTDFQLLGFIEPWR